MIRNTCNSIRRYLALSITVMLLLLAGASSSYADEGYGWSGSGTSSDPYLISTYSELCALSQTVKKGESFEGQYFRLTDNISLEQDWVPVGALKDGETGAGSGVNINPFSGSFSGGGCTVTSAAGGYSLFGYLRHAEISDLNIAGSDIRGNGLIHNYVSDKGPQGISSGEHIATITRVTIVSGTNIQGSGFVSGYASAGNLVDIIDCVAEEGVVLGADKNVGKVGSFGGDFNGTVTGSRSAATVYGTEYVGGIIGCKGNSMSASSITGCTFTGKVIASGNYAGGIAGGGYGGTGFGINSAPNAPRLKVQSCHCSGEVTATDVAGGIVGFETTVQSWDNGKGYYEGNLFTGTVTTTGGSCAGGLAGSFRGIDKYDFIQDNYYAEGCGADRGIGKITYVDTSCAAHETVYGENYFDTSTAIPDFSELSGGGQFSNIKPDHNRTDDPLGADAAALAKAVTDAELTDGTVVDLLNNAAGSLQNWTQGTAGPVIGGEEPPRPPEKTLVSIAVKDGYKSEYYVGDTFDLTSLYLLLSWSDGTTTEVNGTDSGVTVQGFDSSSAGSAQLTASYEGSSAAFSVTIIAKPDPVDPPGPPDPPVSEDTIYFTLLGDEKHGTIPDEEVHTKAKGNLTAWIPATAVRMPHGSTAKDVIVKVLGDNNIAIAAIENTQYGYYISGIEIPGTGTYLIEKDNGPNSGWMYSVNGVEPNVTTGEYVLDNGDEVILFYTDDFTKESSAPGGDDPDDPTGEAAARAKELEHAAELIEGAAQYTEKESIYTEESYKAFSDALKALQELIKDDSAASAVIKAANEALENAVKELITKEEAEKEAERKAKAEAVGSAEVLIAEAAKYEETSSAYTASSYSAFEKALNDLKAVVSDAGRPESTVTSKEINDAKDALETAISGLKARKKQPMKVKPAKGRTFKASSLRKKARRFTGVTVKNAKGKVTYKVSGNGKSKKALKFNKKTRKITVRKKVRKGTYRLKIKVTAAGNGTYKAGSRTVTVKVRVK